MSIDPKFEKVFTNGSLANLATIKRDGRPQLSIVSYAYDPDTSTFRISVTADRAKTANLRRDPRASLLVAGDNRWQYAVAEGTAQLGEIAREPNDGAADELVDLFRTLAGEHPDWDEFREAMVEEGRLVLRVVADRAYGAAG
ncbi:TIGR03618 family F420-dependent PPOX class oxidoreductase [Epidermidibacterium keratini]|uniref:TIGR03618 family F420-dependent PPOX class oxidoreductase n=1 Tax=Epidermidibacterium keratini TaxID=1891644 RepID=A0A7L4YMV9_9ACTN|nr:PPOX class F420-dependent oxidoreductase [Epidermidibacterium keratini]QHC00418.1 TIGR03618 family F420-dependent PPOX class oxidoreductase [Epidermidibacterium keratini]